MRQVPELDRSPIGIAGDGRVARHFLHYFNLLGRPVRTWSRRASNQPPPDAFDDCDTVLILLSDSAVVPFIETWPALRSKRLVHCSGCLVTPRAEAAHPLMTFGADLYDLDTYSRIPFIVDAGATPFDVLMPGLPNPSFAIPAMDRPYYHALCVMAGNFSTLLWLKLLDGLQTRFSIPAAAALPYLEQVAANFRADPSHALTGPLARGDITTVDANLRALAGDPFQAVYAAFTRAYDERS
jgi:predicted short-subunit dehydrogenase-like oxidoreductase (DUF2520 family)